MHSEGPVAVQRTEYLKEMIVSAEGFYNRTKSAFPIINSGLSRFEYYMTPVTKAIKKYSSPVIEKIDVKFSQIIEVSSKTYKDAKITYEEKKKLYKSGMKAWVSDHRNFSEFLDKLKSFYSYDWKDSIEEYALDFYTKSLNYKKPSQMLKFAADLLSEGSDIFCGNLILAWKKVDNVSEYFNKLQELMGDGWKESFKENARIFLSISKLKDRILLDGGLVRDWKNQAKNAAETTSLILLVGVDEFYMLTASIFSNEYLEFIQSGALASRQLVMDLVDRAKKTAETTSFVLFAGADQIHSWSTSTLSKGYLVLYNNIYQHIPFKSYIEVIYTNGLRKEE
jgi:hypothetical protein